MFHLLISKIILIENCKRVAPLHFTTHIVVCKSLNMKLSDVFNSTAPKKTKLSLTKLNQQLPVSNINFRFPDVLVN